MAEMPAAIQSSNVYIYHTNAHLISIQILAPLQMDDINLYSKLYYSCISHCSHLVLSACPHSSDIVLAVFTLARALRL